MLKAEKDNKELKDLGKKKKRKKKGTYSKGVSVRNGQGKQTSHPIRLSVRNQNSKRGVEWTKYYNLIKNYIVLCFQNYRKKSEDILKKFSTISQNRYFRLLIIFLFGVSMIIIGGWFSFANRIREMPQWSKAGPAVLIACDSPLKGLQVISETGDDGITTLSFFQLEIDDIPIDVDNEEYHFWVYINSCEDTLLNWSFDSNIGNVENYRIIQPDLENSYFFVTEKTDKSQGVDGIMAFRISFGGSNFGAAQIFLSENADHAIFRGNGYYWPRLPWIRFWSGFNTDLIDNRISDFISNDDNYSYFDTPMLMIDTEPMYVPLMDIYLSYASISLINNHNLEISTIKPAPENEYPLIQWHSYFSLIPTIQFYDREWESTAKKNTLFGGIFIGLGVNILLVTFNFPEKEGERKKDVS